MRSGASRAQCGRYEQIVPLTLSLIRDRSIRVPPSLLVTSTSVDGIGMGQYGAEASCSTVDITGVPPPMAATARLRHFAGFRVIRTNIRHPSLAFLSLGSANSAGTSSCVTLDSGVECAKHDGDALLR